MISEVLLISTSLVIGWAALLPMLRVVNPLLFHLAAIPVGLLVWVLSTALLAATGLPLWLTSLIVAPVYVIGCQALLRSMGCGRIRLQQEDITGFIVAGAIIVALTAVAAAAGYTVVTNDGRYELAVPAARIWIDSSITPVVMDRRNLLLPSIMAAQRLFGGEWLTGFFPLVALHCMIAVFALVSLRPNLSTQRERWVARASGIAVAHAMLGTGTFLLHSLYVHTNLMSAMYLTLAVTMLVFAREVPPEGSGTNAGRAALLLVAGLSLAGLALVRNDGIAYTLVPLALFANFWLADEGTADELDAILFPLIVVVGAVFGGVIVALGFWEASKFSGNMALAGFLGLCAAYGVLFLSRQSDIFRRILYVTTRFSVLLAIGSLAVAARFVERPIAIERFVAPALSNLLQHGRWDITWYALAGTWLIGVVLATRVGVSSRTMLVGFVLVGTLLVKLLVPLSAHEPTWADSTNRFMVHLIPLSFALTGLFVSRLAETLARDR